MQIPKHILPVIVLAQFCCTSLWFASNGVIGSLTQSFALPESALSHLTTVVQFGFISGTLIFALFMIADRFAPSAVFLVCALLGAIFNWGIIWEGHQLWTLLLLRFFTGFFLAGIYPVGMKIAADYYDRGLGKSLGYLVGALVVGTALPHLLKSVSGNLSWRFVITTTSILATLGGIAMYALVPNGPFRRASQQLDLAAFFKVFRTPKFRAAAFGYFGHMWELYTFWAFVPILLTAYLVAHQSASFDVSLWCFLIIGVGGLGCVVAGYVSQQRSEAVTAMNALSASGWCCLLSPLVFLVPVPLIFMLFLLVWGFTVVADSPLLSTLVAKNAHPEIKGTALTIVNCLGFATTIVSIQAINALQSFLPTQWLLVPLVVGPIFGLRYLKNS